MSLSNKLKPKTFFEELAIDNNLREYIDTNVTILERYNTDKIFRNEMLNLLYVHSDKYQKDVQNKILEELNDTLSYFNENTARWTKINL